MQEAVKITDEVQFLDPRNLKIARDSFEELIVELPDGTTHTNVEAVRSFPLTDSNKYITLLDSEGRGNRYHSGHQTVVSRVSGDTCIGVA